MWEFKTRRYIGKDVSRPIGMVKPCEIVRLPSDNTSRDILLDEVSNIVSSISSILDRI